MSSSMTDRNRITSAIARLMRAHAEQEPGENGRRIYEKAVLDALDVLTGHSDKQYAPPGIAALAQIDPYGVTRVDPDA